MKRKNDNKDFRNTLTKIISMVKKGWVTKYRLGKEINASPNTIYDIIEELDKKGFVTSREKESWGDLRKANEYIYNTEEMDKPHTDFEFEIQLYEEQLEKLKNHKSWVGNPPTPEFIEKTEKYLIDRTKEVSKGKIILDELLNRKEIPIKNQKIAWYSQHLRDCNQHESDFILNLSNEDYSNLQFDLTIEYIDEKGNRIEKKPFGFGAYHAPLRLLKEWVTYIFPEES